MTYEEAVKAARESRCEWCRSPLVAQQREGTWRAECFVSPRRHPVKAREQVAS